ncbi:MAG: DNA recombination protein RmuC, partial [Pseudomonadota bacterium]
CFETMVDLESLSVLQQVVLAIVLGALAGGLLVHLFARARRAAESELASSREQAIAVRLAERDEQLNTAQSQSSKLSAELVGAKDMHAGQQAELARLRTELELTRREAQERQKFQQQERVNLKNEFDSLAQKILDEKSAKFTQQNMQNLGTVINPLREQMGEFKKRVEDVYDKESRDRAFLASEIKQLKGLNERISQDAINLTNALKGDSKTRGNWGEIILERILEDAGLREGIEFEREVSLNQESGSRGRPDVVIHLPDKHDLIVDAKVSLGAFEEAMSVEVGEARDQALKRHVASLRNHVRELSQKSYQSLVGVNTLDFVLMFVPIEPALHAAFAEAPDLFQEAYERNIFIVSPTTLLMACRTVEHLWRTDSQNKNAQEISREAANMLDKFVAFVEDLDDIGKQIVRADESYQKARNKLDTGKGNLINRANKIEKLGAKGRKQLPEPESPVE